MIHLTKSINIRKDRVYNLNLLDTLLPFCLTGGMDYRIYYNYRDMVPLYNDGVIFPFYIIINRSAVILLSPDLQNAALFKLQEYTDFYTMAFENMLKKSRKLIELYDNNLPVVNDILKPGYSTPNSFYLEFQPFFLLFTEREMVEYYIKSDLKDRELIVKLALARYDQFHSAALPCILFTQAGIDFFIKYGFLSGFPSQYTLPVLPADRLIFLKKLYNYAKSNPEAVQIINPDHFYLPDFINISVHPDSGINFFIYQESSPPRCIHIQEGTLTQAFTDFISEITGSPIIFSAEKTLELLDQYVKNFPLCGKN